jgi:hypothetical protein
MFPADGTLVLALKIYNIHTRYAAGADALTPTGLILLLSAIAALRATPWRPWAPTYR